MRRFFNQKGFSLIELMIVVAIIGILAAVALPQFAEMAEEAKKTKVKEHLATFIKQIGQWEVKETLPLTALDMLEGRYMQSIPKDPWGNAYGLDPKMGVCFSRGKNGAVEYTNKDQSARGDDIIMSYLPEMSLKQVTLVDSGNRSGEVDEGDKLTLTFTRPLPQEVRENEALWLADAGNFAFFDMRGKVIEENVELMFGTSAPDTALYAGLGVEIPEGGEYYDPLVEVLTDEEEGELLNSVTIVMGSYPLIRAGATMMNIDPETNPAISSVSRKKGNANITDMMGEPCRPSGIPIKISF